MQQKVIEQLAEILRFAEEENYEGSRYRKFCISGFIIFFCSHHINICRESYNVIRKFLEGDSRKNENYLAHFIEFFQKHVRQFVIFYI